MHQLQLIFTFLSLSLSVVVSGQPKDKYNESLWSIIDLEHDKTSIQKSDTMVVITTTREYTPSGTKKFQDHFDSLSTLRYLLAIKYAGRWKLYFMNSLEEAFSYFETKKDIVFYVEGMGKTFTTNLYRSAGLALQYNVHVIMFDYPSAKTNYSRLKNFHLSKTNSTKAAPLYARFLYTVKTDQLKKKEWISDNHITLFHHSMGNRMLKQLVLENLVDSLSGLTISALVLNAACVEQKKHTRWIHDLSFAQKIIINYNPKDLHLKAARLIIGKRQLGQSNNSSTANHIVYVNLHSEMGTQHSAFLNRPGGYLIPASLHNYYNTIFHGK